MVGFRSEVGHEEEEQAAAQTTACGHYPAHQEGGVSRSEGKTLEAIKLYLELDDTSLCLLFSDNTQLDFDLEPGLTVRTELSDWKTGNRRSIKNWPRFDRGSFWVREPGPPAG